MSSMAEVAGFIEQQDSGVAKGRHGLPPATGVAPRGRPSLLALGRWVIQGINVRGRRPVPELARGRSGDTTSSSFSVRCFGLGELEISADGITHKEGKNWETLTTPMATQAGQWLTPLIS